MSSDFEHRTEGPAVLSSPAPDGRGAGAGEDPALYLNRETLLA